MDRARCTTGTCSVFFEGELGDSPIPRGSTFDSLQYTATIMKVQSVGLHGLDGAPFIYYLLTLGPAGLPPIALE
jgi:hypothetical protein